jgi:hypothetical protein
MRDQIISYREMCNIENCTLQRGMNFRLNTNYSVLLMSQRANAPYADLIHEDGITIEYEGHDLTSAQAEFPKLEDQPRFLPSGKPTQNGRFALAVDEYRKKKASAEIVRIYEKLFDGTWSDKGFFKLIDYKYLKSGQRNVFRFILEEADVDFENNVMHVNKLKPRSRIIPSEIKRIVWERDGGMCVQCGAIDELHFDHDLPFSKGGSSITVDNVKILCARHNLEKSDRIG